MRRSIQADDEAGALALVRRGADARSVGAIAESARVPVWLAKGYREQTDEVSRLELDIPQAVQLAFQDLSVDCSGGEAALGP